jgi:hypothetical protein
MLYAFIFSMVLGIPLAGSNGGQVNPSAAPLFALGFMVPFLVFGAIFVGGALFVIYGVIGAIQVVQGKDFRYIILGDRLRNYLNKNS